MAQEKFESAVEISNINIENVNLEFLNRLGHNTKLKLLLQLAKKYALPEIQKHLGKIKEENGESAEYLSSLLLLFVAFVKREEEVLKEGLGSSSMVVRNAAVNFLVRVSKTASAIDFLVNFALVTFVSLRKRIIKIIKRYKRRDIADKLLAGMKMFLPLKESCSLLTACSEEVVKWSIGELGFGIKNWPSIAQYHPFIFIDYVRSVFLITPLIDRPSLWLKFKRGFEKYVKSNKDISPYFDLIDQFSDPSNPLHPSITGLYGILIKRDKERVYAMLMRGPSKDGIAAGGIPRAILSNLRLFSYDQQLSLARILISNHIPDSLHPLFEVVPPGVRNKLFVDLYSEEQMKTMSWGSTMKYLKGDLVVKLVKYALDKKPAVKDEIHLNTLLPDLEEVHQFFLAKIKAHGASIRGEALRSYIKWAGSIHRWDIVNSLIDQYQNDQPEVIQSLIMGFINIDGKGYTSQVLSLIEKITMIDKKRFEKLGRNYLQTLSPIIQRAIDYQINAALPSEQSFRKALELSMLISQTPIYNYRIRFFLDHLPQPVVHKIIDIYLSFFALVENDNNYHHRKEASTLSFIRTLSHHYHYHPSSIQFIKSTLHKKEMGGWELYVAPPLTRDVHLKELLLKDPSFSLLDIAKNHLHHRRQEWILPLLHHHSGYWKSMNCYRFVWKKKEGYQKWPYNTCIQYVTSSIDDINKQKNQFLLLELKYICKVPTASISDLSHFIDIPNGKEEDPYYIAALEAALQYSAHLDSHMERTLDLLISHLHGDRARVAMYSIPRVVRFLPIDHLESVFRQQLNQDNNKITVQKEWIRLIGVYGVAVDVLFEYWKKEKVSRDVRVAISHACRGLLYREEVWGLLEEIAEHPNKDVCGSILSLPPSLSPSHRDRYAKLILKVCNASDHVETRRLAYQCLVKFSQGIEKEIIEKAMEAMVEMKYNNEWYAALTCLIQVSASSSQPDVWSSSIKQLLQIPLGDLTPSKLRDLPSIQRFLRFLDYLSSLPPFYRKFNERAFEEISKIIADHDEVLIVDACRIKLAIITDDKDIDKIVRVLREVAILTTSQIYNLPLLIQVVDHVWSKSLQKVQDNVVTELYKDASPSVRYFAFFLFELTLHHRNQSSTNVLASFAGYRQTRGRRVRNAVVRDSLKDEENTRVYSLPYFGAIYIFRQDPLSPPSSVPDPQLTLDAYSLLLQFRRDPCEGIRALSSRVFSSIEPIY